MLNQDSNHRLVKIIRSKGWSEFEIYHSAIKNEYQGWFIECASNKDESNHAINNIFLGCTLKDAIFTAKHMLFTREIFYRLLSGELILESYGKPTKYYMVDVNGRRKDEIDKATFLCLKSYGIIRLQKGDYYGSSNSYFEIHNDFNKNPHTETTLEELKLM